MSKVFHLPENYFASDHIRYIFLEGHFCKTMNDCYDTLQRQLSLPVYFGRNLDALEEVLSDLEWVKEEIVKIIVADADHLLSGELGKKHAFLDILNSADSEKVEVIYLAYH